MDRNDSIVDSNNSVVDSNDSVVDIETIVYSKQGRICMVLWILWWDTAYDELLRLKGSVPRIWA